MLLWRLLLRFLHFDDSDADWNHHFLLFVVVVVVVLADASQNSSIRLVTFPRVIEEERERRWQQHQRRQPQHRVRRSWLTRISFIVSSGKEARADSIF